LQLAGRLISTPVGLVCAVTGMTGRVAVCGQYERMKTFQSLGDLESCVGQHVATSDWITVSQNQINLFAQATGDSQWIHTDVERAAKGPFGTTIAHGFLTLSLLPVFFESALSIEGSLLGVNYGLNKVRFMSPVPVDSRLRADLELLAFEWIDNRGCQLTWRVTVMREGQEKPVCLAESVVRRYP
jgi:acyl dehydratase